MIRITDITLLFNPASLKNARRAFWPDSLLVPAKVILSIIAGL